MTDLSVIIPARNEIFLRRTIEDLLANIRADTDIIAVLDGQWADPTIDDHPRVRLIYHSQPIGQRAACNEAVRMSNAKYVMKLDAHCAVDEGFDVKLMEDMQPDWTMVPLMRNLHTFDWVCKNGHRRYQGPSGVRKDGGLPTEGICSECGEPTWMDIVWIPKRSPSSTSYCFDPTPHFQYFNSFRRRPEGQGPLSETMSLQGSCFMMEKQRYLDLDVCDESWGFWGSQGIEVACKSWLSGGRVMVSHKTWYAHQFRTQGSDFGFPYHLSGKQVERAKKTARELFFENKWCKQVRPISWLVERFWPVDHWTDEDLANLKKNDKKFEAVPVIHRGPSKGIVYYTDNRLDEKIANAVRWQLYHCRYRTNGSGAVESERYHNIVAVSLKQIEDYKWLAGDNEIVLPLERGYLTMFKQILAGLEDLTTDIVFLAEHDILYHPSHFEFVPPRTDIYYYNQNSWKVDSKTGRALFYYCNQTFGLCAYRDLLLEHYRKRVERVEKEGNFDRRIGFEPGTHLFPRGIDNYGWESWMSEVPNLDIRHGLNLTKSRWSKDQFRNQKYCEGWTESEVIPGWGKWSEVMEGL